MAKQHDDLAPKGYHWVYSPYITLKGKRIYPKRAKVFRFLAKD